MSQNKTADRSILTLAVLGSIIFVNVLGLTMFERFDLTRDGQFTLGYATRDTLKGLEEPVTVRAYFSRDLPPPYSTQARYVRDLLEEYYAEGNGNFRYEFIDPKEEESSEDKKKKKDLKQDIFGNVVRELTSIERELQELGIPSVQVQVNDGDKVSVERAYLGLAIKVGEEKDVIPVVQETGTLEYNLTTMIRRLSREKTPKLVFVTGHGEPTFESGLSQMKALLDQLYDVTASSVADIPADADALLIVGPATRFSVDELKAIDNFVMSGRSVAFLVDEVKADFQTLQTTPTDHGLQTLLSAYGVQIEGGLIIDTECAPINVTQQRGFMRISQPVQYPYMLMPKALDDKHPMTRGLANVVLPFVTPLRVELPENSPAEATVLIESSADSSVVQTPFNLDPMQRWTEEQFTDQKSRPVVITIMGSLLSPFGEDVVSSDSSRVLVAGGAGFMTDGVGSPGNEALMLNMVDWLVLDTALFEIRTRGLAAAPLVELEDGTKQLIRYGNIFGVPALFVGFGLFRWRRRESRRKSVQLS